MDPIALPADTRYCYGAESKQAARDAVQGWLIIQRGAGYDLRSPEGKVMSPGLAPEQVRCSFRAWIRGWIS